MRNQLQAAAAVAAVVVPTANEEQAQTSYLA